MPPRLPHKYGWQAWHIRKEEAMRAAIYARVSSEKQEQEQTVPS